MSCHIGLVWEAWNSCWATALKLARTSSWALASEKRRSKPRSWATWSGTTGAAKWTGCEETGKQWKTAWNAIKNTSSILFLWRILVNFQCFSSLYLHVARCCARGRWWRTRWTSKRCTDCIRPWKKARNSLEMSFIWLTERLRKA